MSRPPYPMSFAGFTGDSIPGIIGAWGVKQLRAGYGAGGNLFRINSTQLIAILPSGWTDWNTADAYAGAAYRQITDVYDQSGYGHHLVRPSGNPGFSYPHYATDGCMRGFCLDGLGDAGASPCLAATSGLSIDRSDFSLTIVGRVNNVGERAVLAALGGADTCLFLPGDGGSPLGGLPLSLQASRGAVIASMPGGLSDNRCVITLNSTPAGLELHVNETCVIASALPSNILNSLFIGDAPTLGTGKFQLFADFYAVYLGRSMTAAQLATMRQRAYIEFGLLPIKTRELVLIGDSITTSAQSQGRGWPRLLGEHHSELRIHNLGVSGAKVQTLASPAFLPGIAGALSGTIAGVVIWAGSNDDYFGAAAADIFGYLSALVGVVKSITDAPVYIVTMLPRGTDPTVETTRQAYNAMIRSIPDAAVIDLDDEPSIGRPGAQSNTIYFRGDQTHPTAAGAVIVAAALETRIMW